MAATVPGAVSLQRNLDQDKAAWDQAAANVCAAEASLASCKLNLVYTKITAPVSGRVSRYAATVGNLIQAGDQSGGTLLTTIVSVDPVYACFDVDEATIQRLRQWIHKADAQSGFDEGLPITLRLATEQGFSHQGTINFVDNQVNPENGYVARSAAYFRISTDRLPGILRACACAPRAASQCTAG